MTAATCAAGIVACFAVTALRPAQRCKVTRRRRRSRPAVVSVALAAAALAGLAGPAALATCGAWLAGRWRRVAATRRVRAARRDALPDAVEMIVLAARAGHTPANALRVVCSGLPAAVRPAFAGVVAALDGGARFADALRVLDTSLGPDADGLVDALGAAEHYGLPLAPVLDRLAAEARDARRRRADAAARELPVRLAAPLVLCTLPSFVLLAIVPLLIGTFHSLHN